MYIYYPSCNFMKASPATEKKVKAYLKQGFNINHTKCCRIEDLSSLKDFTALTVCQACNEEIQRKEPAIQRMSIWEFIDQDSDFIFPDFKGEKMVLQDCFRDAQNPKAYNAVRSIMLKMNIQIIELNNKKENADFCGLLHYEPKNSELKDLWDQYDNCKLSRLPLELQKQFMEEHVALYKDNLVVCYCNSCLRGIKLGGGNGVHLLDLVMQTK